MLRTADLHSNMDRLKHIDLAIKQMVAWHLHSNMDRLKHGSITDGLTATDRFTFQYG